VHGESEGLDEGDSLEIIGEAGNTLGGLVAENLLDLWYLVNGRAADNGVAQCLRNRELEARLIREEIEACEE
jgi:hypothetical protein